MKYLSWSDWMSPERNRSVVITILGIVERATVNPARRTQTIPITKLARTLMYIKIHQNEGVRNIQN